MSKQKQDARVFAVRVKMSRIPNWILVEGRSHDRPFYDRVTETIPSLSGGEVQLRLVEQISVDGVAAGGKSHSMKLHQVFEADGTLSQTNRAGDRNIFLIVDKDVDEYAGAVTSEPHLVYTEYADVEAEILAHSNIINALSSSFGVSRREFGEVLFEVANPLEYLAQLWTEWLFLGILAIRCESPQCPRMRAASTIQTGRYGPTDPAKAQMVLGEIATGVKNADFMRTHAQAVALHHAASVTGRMVNAVKGKWASHFVVTTVYAKMSDEFLRVNVQPDAFVASCIETIDFTDSWTDHYDAQFARVLTA